MPDNHQAHQPQANRQLTYAEVHAVYAHLRKVKEECHDLGMKRPETACVLIAECIDKGFNTGKRITSALGVLGYNKRHVGILLCENTGSDPTLHGWRRYDDGVYATHVPVAA